MLHYNTIYKIHASNEKLLNIWSDSKNQKYRQHKTGVVNDPLGQSTARPAVKIYVVSFDFEKLGRTDDTCENSDHYRPCVSQPSGSVKPTRTYAHRS